MAGFQEFSLESAFTPQVRRTPVKLSGMGNVARIYTSNSMSTEEFISGAISDLGVADRSIMYVNSTLNALSDRLNVASKIAHSINTSKRQGVEGFRQVEYMDPWAYAVEGKVGEFFKKIWQAIRTACRRIITMIANFIRWLGNVVLSVDVKYQIRDYAEFLKHKSKIDKMSKASKIDKVQFSSLKWKIDATKLGKMMKKAAGEYAKIISKSHPDTSVIENASKTDFKYITNIEDFAKVYGKIFGIAQGGFFSGVGNATIGKNSAIRAGKGRFYGRAKEHVDTLINGINKDLETGVASVFGIKKEKGLSAKNIVWSSMVAGEKTTKMTCGEMRKLSGDFSVLSDKWLADNVKASLSVAHQNQQNFTAYTKNIDKIAANFDKITSQTEGMSEIGSLSHLTAQLANARVRYNSFYSSLMLELEAMALRFRRSAHIAIKQYMKAGTGAIKNTTKSNESYSRTNSLENLFDF